VGEAELVAVCDARPEAAEALAGEFGVARTAVGLEALLAGEPLDLAIVATWGDSHAEVTRALAASGRVRAILCEKPISLTAAEAESMAAAARAGGVLLAEAFKFRHHPAHLEARELVDAGAIGRVSHVRSTFSTSTPSNRRDPELNWRFNRRRGGGAIYDLGCYCTHHARWLMGAEPTAVHALGRAEGAGGVDEVVAATLAFPGDRSAQWWVSFGDAPSQEVEVFGSEGRLRIERAWNNEDQPTAVELIGLDGQVRRLEFEPVFQFALQLRHMCECIRDGQPPRVPVEDSIGQMRALDALRASLRSGVAEPVAGPAAATR
jgi:predicted dehydrogenase